MLINSLLLKLKVNASDLKICAFDGASTLISRRFNLYPANFPPMTN